MQKIMQMVKWSELSQVLIGTAILSITMNYFIVPNNLSEGGIIGTSILIHYLTSWNLALISLVGNIIIFAIGYRFLQKKVLIYSIVSFIFGAFVLAITENIGTPFGGDKIVAALYAGCGVGFGIGLVFRAGGTTGGGTIIAKVLEKVFHIGVAKAMLIIDTIVVLASIPVIGRDDTMYTLVAIVVGTLIIEYMATGLNRKKAVTIIADHPEAIAKVVSEQMHRGITLLQGKGYYHQTQREVLYIVLETEELKTLKELVKGIEPHAFMVVHDVNEVFGEGFTH